MQTIMIAHSNYNLASASVDRRSVLRSQLTRRRHSLAQESITAPAIAVNGNRVQMMCSIPSRAMLTISQQQHQLSQPQVYFYPYNQRRFSSSASLAAAAATTAAAATGGNGTNGTTGTLPFTQVAIDSKIEQAMDLVKTHLMFAVREEVELLRTKIVELESAVIHLEAENSILREHVPQTVLQNLQPASNNNNGSSSNNNITHSGGGGSGSDAALLGAAMASLGQPNMAHPQTAQ